jgi:hypothetical protein
MKIGNPRLPLRYSLDFSKEPDGENENKRSFLETTNMTCNQKICIYLMHCENNIQEKIVVLFFNFDTHAQI